MRFWYDLIIDLEEEFMDPFRCTVMKIYILFVNEVKAFFNDHIPEIDYIDFFNQIIPSYNNVDTSILNWNLVYFEIQNALNEENG